MTFFTRNCCKFRLNSVKGLRVTKNVKEIKFEGVWGELKSKKMIPDTKNYETSKTNSSFYAK